SSNGRAVIATADRVRQVQAEPTKMRRLEFGPAASLPAPRVDLEGAAALAERRSQALKSARSISGLDLQLNGQSMAYARFEAADAC
ncbi:MAG TPA: hypothetical protein VF161_12265, partial [Steroidobacteraceae bacterium]